MIIEVVDKEVKTRLGDVEVLAGGREGGGVLELLPQSIQLNMRYL
jgi:hypothetical protein